MDEYCFTSLAIIHVHSDQDTSSKHTLERYPYTQYEVNSVLLETEPIIDIDIQINFKMGNVPFVIDIQKNDIERLKDLYKAVQILWDLKKQDYGEIFEIYINKKNCIRAGAPL